MHDMAFFYGNKSYPTNSPDRGGQCVSSPARGRLAREYGHLTVPASKLYTRVPWRDLRLVTICH
jgi:hypothetical protein